MEDQNVRNRKTSYRIFFGLFSTILIILVYRYINFLWRRRKLYTLSWNMPGPLAFPFWGNVHLFYGGLNALSKVVDNLARIYPDIFRIWVGPHLLYCILKPEYIEKILCHKLDKAVWVNEILSHDFAGYGLLFLPVTSWKRHRKLILPSFGQHILDSYVEKFNDRAEVLRDQLQSHIGETNFGLREKLFKYAVDIVCGKYDYFDGYKMITMAFTETLMGVKVDFQTTDSDIGTDLSRILEILTIKLYSVWYHIDIVWRLSPLYRELKHLNKKVRKNYIMSMIYEKTKGRQKNCILVDERKDKFGKKLPFLDWILKTTDFDETEMKDEIDTFMAAGSDTTTVIVCCSMIAMGMYQDIQKRVHEEIMEICGPHRRILPSDMNKLKYTERVVKETLRLFPPAPFILRNIDRDLDLGEHMLSEGASSIFCIRTIHTNPKYWPNPYEFDPDRFLPENIIKRHPCSFIPFSYGPRNCIGGRFAMMEILTTIAVLIRRFKFFTEYKTIEEIELIPTIVLELKHGDKVRLELR